MNDTMKIKALMIFYEHWGKEENRIRKNMEGANQFKNLICKSYKKRYIGVLDVLKDCNKTNINFWYCLVECLLADMNHWVPYYDYPQHPFYIRLRFAERIGIPYGNMSHIVLDQDEMRSIDAIVAL